MTVFRYYVPPTEILDPNAVVGEIELLDVGKTRLVGRLDDVAYVQIYGRFSFSSPRDFGESPVERIVLSTDREGSEPIFAIEQLDATLLSIGRDPASVFFGGNDLFIGSPGDDRLTFFEDPKLGRGNDTMRGGEGDDELHGGAGADRLFGEAGGDTLYSGPGKDQATGGPGADRFVLLGNSRGSAIRDFDAASGDRLELRAADLFADPAGAQADPADFVRLTAKGTKSTLFLDPDGGGDRFVKWASIKGDLGSTDLDQLIADGTLVIG